VCVGDLATIPELDIVLVVVSLPAAAEVPMQSHGHIHGRSKVEGGSRGTACAKFFVLIVSVVGAEIELD
jgi:hypothetical protein